MKHITWPHTAEIPDQNIHFHIFRDNIENHCNCVTEIILAVCVHSARTANLCVVTLILFSSFTQNRGYTLKYTSLNISGVRKYSFFFNVITFIASFLRGATQGNMTSQRERTVPEMTHAQPWLPSPTADPHSHDCNA